MDTLVQPVVSSVEQRGVRISALLSPLSSLVLVSSGPDRKAFHTVLQSLACLLTLFSFSSPWSAQGLAGTPQVSCMCPGFHSSLVPFHQRNWYLLQLQLLLCLNEYEYFIFIISETLTCLLVKHVMFWGMCVGEKQF